jgi:hypothetical protein
MKKKIWTRKAVAKECRCSVGTVRRAEGTILFPRIGKDGVRVFDPVEVQAFARLRGVAFDAGPDLPPALLSAMAQLPGDVAARIVRLLLDGRSATEIVLTTVQNPAVIRELEKLVHRDLTRKRASRADRERGILADWAEQVTPPPGPKKTD